jgi:REP element-mobilizing transposase RayT
MNHAHHQLRKGRVSQPGQIYLVTFCTHARKPIFRDHVIATDAVAALLEPRHWADAHLMTWVLMPDHWHGLIQLESDIALSQVIGRLKGASARTLGLRHPHIRPVWQDSFHDRALRAEEDLPTVAHYILNNPVRTGLADTADAYPFSGRLPL